MKIEVGKRYETRDGRKVLLELSGDSTYPFKGTTEDGHLRGLWMDNGRFSLCYDSHRFDLVRGVPDEGDVVPVSELRVGEVGEIVSFYRNKGFIGHKMLRTYDQFVSLNQPQHTWKVPPPSCSVRRLPAGTQITVGGPRVVEARAEVLWVSDPRAAGRYRAAVFFKDECDEEERHMYHMYQDEAFMWLEDICQVYADKGQCIVRLDDGREFWAGV